MKGTDMTTSVARRWSTALDPAFEDRPWFARLEPLERDRFAQDRTAHMLAMGLHFETGLIHGLLTYLDIHEVSPDIRLAIRREIAEEAGHSLLFEEFLSAMRTEHGIRPAVLLPSGALQNASSAISACAADQPALFWLLVLSGEEPIDYLQRKALRRGRHHLPTALVELLEIHTREEASHLALARREVQRLVPSMQPAERQRLGLGVRVLGRRLTKAMLEIPRSALEAAGCPDPAGEAQLLLREEMNPATRRLRGLCTRLDVPTW
jgi:hypothetical protein